MKDFFNKDKSNSAKDVAKLALNSPGNGQPSPAQSLLQGMQPSNQLSTATSNGAHMAAIGAKDWSDKQGTAAKASPFAKAFQQTALKGLVPIDQPQRKPFNGPIYG
jgi:hypothetical protein